MTEEEITRIALKACCDWGCVCDPVVSFPEVDESDGPTINVSHDYWCPLIRMHEGPPPAITQ